MNRPRIALVAFLLSAACDGAQEDAGERIDAKSKATGGEAASSAVRPSGAARNSTGRPQSGTARPMRTAADEPPTPAELS